MHCLPVQTTEHNNCICHFSTSEWVSQVCMGPILRRPRREETYSRFDMSVLEKEHRDGRPLPVYTRWLSPLCVCVRERGTSRPQLPAFHSQAVPSTNNQQPPPCSSVCKPAACRPCDGTPRLASLSLIFFSAVKKRTGCLRSEERAARDVKSSQARPGQA